MKASLKSLWINWPMVISHDECLIFTNRRGALTKMIPAKTQTKKILNSFFYLYVDYFRQHDSSDATSSTSFFRFGSGDIPRRRRFSRPRVADERRRQLAATPTPPPRRPTTAVFPHSSFGLATTSKLRGSIGATTSIAATFFSRSFSLILESPPTATTTTTTSNATATKRFRHNGGTQRETICRRVVRLLLLFLLH